MSALLQPVSPPAESAPELARARADAARPWRSMLLSRTAARTGGLVGLAVTLTVLCLIEYPTVLGRWEIYGLVRTVVGVGPKLSLEINRVGAIYGSSQQYSLVDLSYYTAEWLGWTPQALRLPVLVAGAAAVVIFFVVAKRAFGFWPGLVAALALALNPLFLVYWHLQYVPMFTMTFFLLVIERCQWLEPGVLSRRRWIWGVPALVLAFVSLLMHYGPGRVFGGVVVGYWALEVVWRAFADRRAGRPINRASLVAVPSFLVLVVVTVLLMDERNSQYLAEPTTLIATPRTEFIRSADQAAIVSENLPIMLTAVAPFLDLAPERFADFSTDLMIDYRYYVLPTSMLPLTLLGVAVVVSQAARSSFARLTLVLFAATFAGPLLSSEFDGHVTLSSPRMFFVQPSLYLFVAAGVGWLLARRLPIVRLTGVVLLLALLVFQATTVHAEVGRHRAFIDDLAARWTTNRDTSIFDGPAARRTTDEDELLTNGNYRYYVDFGGVGSRAIAHRIVDRAPWPKNPEEVLVVRLEGVLPQGNRAIPIQVVFELRRLGLAAAWFDPETGSLRGGGFDRPSVVIVVRQQAARQARQHLRQSGMEVSRWTLKVRD